MNDHHTPINLTHYNVKKKKLDSFGSDYLTNYLREDMRNNPAMLEAAKRDRTEMDKSLLQIAKLVVFSIASLEAMAAEEML